jgi:AcrR family transcriptional regulator
MGRTLRPEIYEARRKEILDVAQSLVMGSKGFSDMAIQDILDELRISKGAFYHYFDSKHALLEALIERIVCEAEPILNDIVEEPSLPALSKLDRFFSSIARWKTARKDYLTALLRVWYADENALTREKLRAAMPRRFGPLLNAIVRQGIQEGVMSVAHPEDVGSVVLYLLYDMGDHFAVLLREPGADPKALGRALEVVAAYNDALERILGAPLGSLELVDPEILRAWFEPVAVSAGPSPA